MYDPFLNENGPAAHLRGLSQSLNKSGCEVHILVLNSKSSNRLVNGVQMHYHNPFNIPVAKDFIFSQISSREIDKICRDYGIDIVHGQSPSSYGYSLLRRGDLPFVVTLHGTSFGEFASYFDVPLSFIDRTLISNAAFEMLFAFLTCIEYRCADRVIAVSKATAEETVRFYRLPRERVVAIHNGIDLPSFTDSRVAEGSQEHTILSVGRLSWRKGYKYLIDAMPYVLSEYPNANLLLVGDGIQKIHLQQHTRKLGIENSVFFLGKVSADRLYSLYHGADVYVQPSLYEPFGIAILEAMSMGKAVVATCVGGIPELIRNGVEGLLVEPGSSLQLTRAITDVFSDSSCKKRFGGNARKRVEREFTWEAIAKKTLEFYTNLLNDW
jgi:1,4-alpha-glucan branching enzyme